MGTIQATGPIKISSCHASLSARHGRASAEKVALQGNAAQSGSSCIESEILSLQSTFGSAGSY